VAIATHAGESGRGLNVVGSGRMGGALGLRAARCEPFGRGLSGAAREQPATVRVGPARTVGGVKYQLVLQFQAESVQEFDELVVLEELLVEKLPVGSEVDGHDLGPW
jgi:hypothetical protein